MVWACGVVGCLGRMVADSRVKAADLPEPDVAQSEWSGWCVGVHAGYVAAGWVAGIAACFFMVTDCRAEDNSVVNSMPVKAPPAAGLYDWTGFYVGGHMGYAGGNSNWTANPTQAGLPSTSGSVDMTLPIDAFSEAGSFFMGIQGGYNYMSANRMVLGWEADASFPAFQDLNGLSIGGLTNFNSPVLGAASYGETVLSFGTLRGRIGYAPGNWLFYVTGGLAWTYDQLSLTQVATGTSDSPFLWRFGWTAGAGVEVPIAPNWTAKGEYLWTGYPNATVSYPDLGQRISSNLNLQEFRLGLNYHFSGDAPVSNTAASLTPYADMISLHGQATFTEQAYPSFRCSLCGHQQPGRHRAGARDLRCHAVCRLQAVARRRVLVQSRDRSGIWLRRYPRRGWIPQRRDVQAGLRLSLCARSARLCPADHQSGRRCRKIRRRRQPVRRDAQRGPAGADGRPVWRQRHLRYQQICQ